LGRLIFIGLGLCPEHITLEGLRMASEAQELVSEEYTSMLMDGGLGPLEERLGKRIRILGRSDVEEGDILVDMARTGDVAFLVAGDPLTATTHSEIRTRAAKEGIEVAVCYGVSIQTAAASALGLIHYKFGRTATIPYPEGDYMPTSPYDFIMENHKRGLHTLALLDIWAEEKRYMTIPEALGVLERMEEKTGGGLVKPELLVCGAARIGGRNEKTGAGKLVSLKNVDWGPPLHCIVLPGKLHFSEEEALQHIWIE